MANQVSISTWSGFVKVRNDRTRLYVLIDNMDDWDESGSDTYFTEKVVSYCFRPKDPAKVTPGVGGQTE
jgi:hypothetical protein